MGKFFLSDCYKNKSDQWSTPKHIFEYFNSLGFIDFNPLCVYYKNSFLQPFKNYYCNPPFSNIEPFVDYMIKCCNDGFDCVMLLPVRVMAPWFKKLLFFGCDIVFVGRLKYNDAGFAPFDSMIVYIHGFSTSRVSWNKNFKENNNDSYIQLSIFDFGC